MPRGAEILRFWWSAPAVAARRKKLDDIMVKLKLLPVSDERSAVVAEGVNLRSEQVIRELARKVRSAS